MSYYVSLSDGMASSDALEKIQNEALTDLQDLLLML